MERRFVIFLVVTLLLWTGYIGLSIYLAPPAEEAVAEKADADDPAAVDPAAPDGDPAAEAKPEEKPAGEVAAADDPAAKRAPRKWLQLGSLDATKSAMLVTFDSRGGAVERVELSRYFDVSDTSGYLGHLSLTESDSGGGTINLVGPGTPAALAKPDDPSADLGLQSGDVLRSVNGRELTDVTELESFLSRQTMPRQQIKLVVSRQGKLLTYTATLSRRPLAVVQPENHVYPTDDGGMQILPRDPLSLLVTFDTIGPRTAKPALGEIPGLPPLYTSNWDLDEATDDHVQFSFTLGEPELKSIRQEGSLKLVKRFTLPKRVATSDTPAKEYHVDLQVELHNLGTEERTLAYRMLGPTGLPLEGWWYSTKLHPDWGFKAAGARDVVWKNERGHRLLGNPMIVSEAKRLIADEEPPVVDLLYGDKAGSLDYAGVDTQFFLSAILPQDKAADQPLKFYRAEALPVQDVLEVPKNRLRTTDVSVLLVGDQAKLAGGEKLVDNYQVFFGPKDPRILGNYGLEQTIEMGFELFAFPARMLQGVLTFLYSIVQNYGLAIILLTVLVRSLMVPISLKQAKNAAMMQQLAPEVQKIKEKYPDDALKQHAAVQELYKKHNFNMFSGCLPVFLQLPIFIGLYRCLSVDIDLRDAPLFPEGIAWASNLAGPDKLFRWDSWMPSFIADEAAGWLGPYFNVFPLITVTLFLIQQKLFTPPATD
ncbi:MAG: membrane protein insertase YidC, partial [Pirellulaceae bacterium]|nr:membrane protein insertase YidC [Pirellulaceae bacterium]